MPRHRGVFRPNHDTPRAVVRSPPRTAYFSRRLRRIAHALQVQERHVGKVSGARLGGMERCTGTGSGSSSGCSWACSSWPRGLRWPRTSWRMRGDCRRRDWRREQWAKASVLTSVGAESEHRGCEGGPALRSGGAQIPGLSHLALAADPAATARCGSPGRTARIPTSICWRS
jgi:hypothetical protein